MYKLIMTLGVVAAIGFALGCGSGEDEATSAPLTKAQFIKQAEAVCAKAKKARRAEIAAWEDKAGDPNKVDVDEGLKQVVAPSLRGQAEQLEALEPPVEDEEKVAGMIAMLSKGSRILEKEGEKGVQRSRLGEYERDAAAFGLKSCANL